MNNLKGYVKMWFPLLLIVAFIAGCGGGSGNSDLGSAKAIFAYSLDGATGTIDETARTIAVTVPNGTNLSALVATFTSIGTGVKVGDVAQTSGATANNFTNPVVYTVFAGDSTTATYSVIVSVATLTAKAITTYSLAGYAGTVNETSKTIAVTVPNGTNATALVATYTTTGKEIKVGSVVQKSGSSANDFTNPVEYVVSAGDSATSKYTVTVSIADDSAKAITAYSLAGIEGTINESAKTISVLMPYGSKVSSLAATFTSTGTSVKVGAVLQMSRVTMVDLSHPVDYIVTAADGTTATYTVTITVAKSSAKAITAYSFAGFTGAAGTINEEAKTVEVNLPSGTNVTNLVAIFATKGNIVKVDSMVQTSAATANNFTTPVHYTVKAADGSTATYLVTVNVAPGSAKAVTAYSFTGLSGSEGIIDEAKKTIAVSVPKGTVVKVLIAKFSTNGTAVKVGTVAQTSTVTPNDFTSPVAYTITAADNSTEIYTVTVKVAVAAGPAPVLLGSADKFVILAKSGVSTTGTTAVVGNIGLSPSAASYITGFSLIADSTNTFSISSLVTGKIYASDYAPPTPSVMTTAIGDMELAFTDAAGRSLPDYTELGAGDISGLTLVPGLYKWGTGVLITGVGVTLKGGADDVWIFQIAQDLTVNNSAIITLAGGAQAKNIFWQVSGQATLGTAADFKGNLLSQTLISFNTGAVMNGRALAQTAVTLNATTVTAP